MKKYNYTVGEVYSYLDAMVSDIIEYMEENHIEKIAKGDLDAENELAERLQDELWDEDSVTGNASGSYTCNAWKAEELLHHNMNLLRMALEEFGADAEMYKKALESAEFADVTIRCYLLTDAIYLAIHEYSEWGD